MLEALGALSLPSPSTLGLAFGLSELGLALFKRSRGTATSADRGSLRLLWLVILSCIALAMAAALTLPHAAAPFLRRSYPAGVALFAAGLAFRWYAIFYLGRFFTVDVAIAADHRLVDSGPYRFIRHPSYAGVLVAFVGLGICYGNWVSLALLTFPIALAFARRIGVEEAALRAALGESYAEYVKRTRRLIPFIY